MRGGFLFAASGGILFSIPWGKSFSKGGGIFLAFTANYIL
jgi:hypothetical protein